MRVCVCVLIEEERRNSQTLPKTHMTATEPEKNKNNNTDENNVNVNELNQKSTCCPLSRSLEFIFVSGVINAIWFLPVINNVLVHYFYMPTKNKQKKTPNAAHRWILFLFFVL